MQRLIMLMHATAINTMKCNAISNQHDIKYELHFTAFHSITIYIPHSYKRNKVLP